jgi:hypothetical protein
MVKCLGKRSVKDFDYDKYPLLTETKLKLIVVVIYEIEEFFTILLFKSISWEIFWNEPWVLDGVETNQVHPVGVTPDSLISEREIIITSLTSALFIA